MSQTPAVINALDSRLVALVRVPSSKLEDEISPHSRLWLPVGGAATRGRTKEAADQEKHRAKGGAILIVPPGV